MGFQGGPSFCLLTAPAPHPLDRPGLREWASGMLLMGSLCSHHNLSLVGRKVEQENSGGGSGVSVCRRNWNEAGAALPPLSSPWLNMKVRQIMWFQLCLASFNLKVKASLQTREICMNRNWNKLTQSPVNWNGWVSHSSCSFFSSPFHLHTPNHIHSGNKADLDIFPMGSLTKLSTHLYSIVTDCLRTARNYGRLLDFWVCHVGLIKRIIPSREKVPPIEGWTHSQDTWAIGKPFEGGKKMSVFLPDLSQDSLPSQEKIETSDLPKDRQAEGPTLMWLWQVTFIWHWKNQWVAMECGLEVSNGGCFQNVQPEP